MPFVRFSRDRRGYEHLYLVESNEHGRSRVIYWFRTPPGVKVGRSPFDAATQRSLEQQYPDVTFDWPQIVAARMPPPTPVENWREKRRAERAFKRARAEEAAGSVEAECLQPTEQVDGAEPPSAENVELGDTEPGVELDLEAVSEGEAPAHNIAAGPLVGEPAPGTRRKRRRRRRGRRPDRPAEAAGPLPAADGPLDPSEPLEKPSKEG